MKKIQVYDPAMCCPTGVCGPAVDPALVEFASFLRMMSRQGVVVERFSLSQEPQKFVANPQVMEILDHGTYEALPLVFCDGQLIAKGSYPTREQLEQLYQAVEKSGLA